MDEPGAESGMNGEAIPIVEVGTSIGVRKRFIYFVPSYRTSTDGKKMNRTKENKKLFRVQVQAAIQVIQIHLQIPMTEIGDDRA